MYMLIEDQKVRSVQKYKMLPLNMPTFNHMVYSLIDLSLFTIAAYQGVFFLAYQQKPYSPTHMCHLYTKHLTNIFCLWVFSLLSKELTFIFLFTWTIILYLPLSAIYADSPNYSFIRLL